jgi:hypothetical protein
MFILHVVCFKRDVKTFFNVIHSIDKNEYHVHFE